MHLIIKYLKSILSDYGFTKLDKNAVIQTIMKIIYANDEITANAELENLKGFSPEF